MQRRACLILIAIVSFVSQLAFTQDVSFPRPAKDRDTNLYGFIDVTGKFTIAPTFLAADDFAGSLAQVHVPDGDTKEGKIGFVSRTGKMQFEMKSFRSVSAVDEYSDGLAFTISGFSCAYMDLKGIVKFKLPSDHCENDDGLTISGRAFRDGLAPFETSEGKWGYVDKKGKDLVRPTYFSADEFHEGLARVSFGTSRVGFINPAGKVVVNLRFDAAGPFSEALSPVLVTGEATKSGFIDKTGHEVLLPAIENGNPAWTALVEHGFHCGMAEVHEGSSDQVHMYINKQGNRAFEGAFRSGTDFVECVAIVDEFDHGWKLIDVTGRTIAELPGLFDADPFHFGLARIKLEDSSIGYVDHVGKVVWQGPQ